MQMYTQFSFLLDLGSEELAREACEAMTSSIDGLDDGEEPVWDELAEAMQGEEPSLFHGIDFSVEDGGIWFRHSDSGNPIGAAILVQAIMKRNGIKEPFGFTFAEIPSGKQYDCYTGGALHVTQDSIDGMNAVTWLGEKMEPPKHISDVHGGTWGQHPDYPREDWQYEVQNGDTGLGYWDWVEGRLEDKALEDGP